MFLIIKSLYFLIDVAIRRESVRIRQIVCLPIGWVPQRRTISVCKAAKQLKHSLLMIFMLLLLVSRLLFRRFGGDWTKRCMLLSFLVAQACTTIGP
jgi:hypothetical protein